MLGDNFEMTNKYQDYSEAMFCSYADYWKAKASFYQAGFELRSNGSPTVIDFTQLQDFIESVPAKVQMSDFKTIRKYFWISAPLLRKRKRLHCVQPLANIINAEMAQKS